MEALLQADEDAAKNGPFNHWSKFQILVQQGKNSESVRWLFLSVSLSLLRYGWPANSIPILPAYTCSKSHQGMMASRMGTWDLMSLQTDNCNQWRAKPCWSKGHCWSNSWLKWILTLVNGLLKFAKQLDTIPHRTKDFDWFLAAFNCSTWTVLSRGESISQTTISRAVGTSSSPADQTWRAGWPESADEWWTLVAAPWMFWFCKWFAERMFWLQSVPSIIRMPYIRMNIGLLWFLWSRTNGHPLNSWITRASLKNWNVWRLLGWFISDSFLQ